MFKCYQGLSFWLPEYGFVLKSKGIFADSSGIYGVTFSSDHPHGLFDLSPMLQPGIDLFLMTELKDDVIVNPCVFETEECLTQGYVFVFASPKEGVDAFLIIGSLDMKQKVLLISDCKIECILTDIKTDKKVKRHNFRMVKMDSDLDALRDLTNGLILKGCS